MTSTICIKRFEHNETVLSIAQFLHDAGFHDPVSIRKSLGMRGMCFVEFSSAKEAAECIQKCNGAPFRSRQVRAESYRPQVLAPSSNPNQMPFSPPITPHISPQIPPQMNHMSPPFDPRNAPQAPFQPNLFPQPKSIQQLFPLPLTLPANTNISREEIIHVYGGAGFFMSRWNNGRLEALMPLEKRSGEGWGIKVGIFGGRRDPNEYDPFNTACRELTEESAGLITWDQANHMVLNGGPSSASIYLPFGKYMMYIACMPSGSFNTIIELYRDKARGVKGAEASFLSWIPFDDLVNAWRSNTMTVQVTVYRSHKAEYETMALPFSGMLKKTMNTPEFHYLVTTTSQTRRMAEQANFIEKI